jgi:hypothetical protein
MLEAHAGGPPNKRLELPAGADGFGGRSLRWPGRPPQLTRSVGRLGANTEVGGSMPWRGSRHALSISPHPSAVRLHSPASNRSAWFAAFVICCSVVCEAAARTQTTPTRPRPAWIEFLVGGLPTAVEGRDSLMIVDSLSRRCSLVLHEIPDCQLFWSDNPPDGPLAMHILWRDPMPGDYRLTFWGGDSAMIWLEGYFNCASSVRPPPGGAISETLKGFGQLADSVTRILRYEVVPPDSCQVTILHQQP